MSLSRVGFTGEVPIRRKSKNKKKKKSGILAHRSGLRMPESKVKTRHVQDSRKEQQKERNLEDAFPLDNTNLLYNLFILACKTPVLPLLGKCGERPQKPRLNNTGSPRYLLSWPRTRMGARTARDGHSCRDCTFDRNYLRSAAVSCP